MWPTTYLKATVPPFFDLNTGDVPGDHGGSFDVVLNCGTSEHVFNQYNTFKIMHDAARVGGLMCHAVPMTGYLAHGVFHLHADVVLRSGPDEPG